MTSAALVAGFWGQNIGNAFFNLGGRHLLESAGVQVHLIQDQLLRVLRDNRVEKIESIGAPFDPNIHEAVSQIETDEVDSQHVAKVIKEGYRFHDTVLRPAMVVVAR